MKIRIMDLFGKPKLLHSLEAEHGAKSLLERMESGEMCMEVLPDSFEQFSGELEAKDYASYCNFLNSVNGKKVMDILEEHDERQLFEL